MNTAVDNIVGLSINALLGNEDGFTFNPVTGQRYTGDHWMVGGIIPELVLDESMSALEFKRLIEEWYQGAKTLDGDDALIGGWVNGKNIHLDLVSLVSDEQEAMLLGKLWKQIAIAKLTADDIIVQNV